MRYIIESFGGVIRGIKKLRCCPDAKRQEVKDRLTLAIQVTVFSDMIHTHQHPFETSI